MWGIINFKSLCQDVWDDPIGILKVNFDPYKKLFQNEPPYTYESDFKWIKIGLQSF